MEENREEGLAPGEYYAPGISLVDTKTGLVGKVEGLAAPYKNLLGQGLPEVVIPSLGGTGSDTHVPDLGEEGLAGTAAVGASAGASTKGTTKDTPRDAGKPALAQATPTQAGAKAQGTSSNTRGWEQPVGSKVLVVERTSLVEKTAEELAGKEQVDASAPAAEVPSLEDRSDFPSLTSATPPFTSAGVMSGTTGYAGASVENKPKAAKQPSEHLSFEERTYQAAKGAETPDGPVEKLHLHHEKGDEYEGAPISGRTEPFDQPHGYAPSSTEDRPVKLQGHNYSHETPEQQQADQEAAASEPQSAQQKKGDVVDKTPEDVGSSPQESGAGGKDETAELEEPAGEQQRTGLRKAVGGKSIDKSAEDVSPSGDQTTEAEKQQPEKSATADLKAEDTDISVLDRKAGGAARAGNDAGGAWAPTSAEDPPVKIMQHHRKEEGVEGRKHHGGVASSEQPPEGGEPAVGEKSATESGSKSGAAKGVVDNLKAVAAGTADVAKTAAVGAKDIVKLALNIGQESDAPAESGAPAEKESGDTRDIMDIAAEKQRDEQSKDEEGVSARTDGREHHRDITQEHGEMGEGEESAVEAGGPHATPKPEQTGVVTELQQAGAASSEARGKLVDSVKAVAVGTVDAAKTAAVGAKDIVKSALNIGQESGAPGDSVATGASEGTTEGGVEARKPHRDIIKEHGEPAEGEESAAEAAASRGLVRQDEGLSETAAEEATEKAPEPEKAEQQQGVGEAGEAPVEAASQPAKSESEKASPAERDEAGEKDESHMSLEGGAETGYEPAAAGQESDSKLAEGGADASRDAFEAGGEPRAAGGEEGTGGAWAPTSKEDPPVKIMGHPNRKEENDSAVPAETDEPEAASRESTQSSDKPTESGGLFGALRAVAGNVKDMVKSVLDTGEGEEHDMPAVEGLGYTRDPAGWTQGGASAEIGSEAHKEATEKGEAMNEYNNKDKGADTMRKIGVDNPFQPPEAEDQASATASQDVDTSLVKTAGEPTAAGSDAPDASGNAFATTTDEDPPVKMTRLDKEYLGVEGNEHGGGVPHAAGAGTPASDEAVRSEAEPNDVPPVTAPEIAVTGDEGERADEIQQLKEKVQHAKEKVQEELLEKMHDKADANVYEGEGKSSEPASEASSELAAAGGAQDTSKPATAGAYANQDAPENMERLDNQGLPHGEEDVISGKPAADPAQDSSTAAGAYAPQDAPEKMERLDNQGLPHGDQGMAGEAKPGGEAKDVGRKGILKNKGEPTTLQGGMLGQQMQMGATAHAPAGEETLYKTPLDRSPEDESSASVEQHKAMRDKTIAGGPWVKSAGGKAAGVAATTATEEVPFERVDKVEGVYH